MLNVSHFQSNGPEALAVARGRQPPLGREVRVTPSSSPTAHTHLVVPLLLAAVVFCAPAFVVLIELAVITDIVLGAKATASIFLAEIAAIVVVRVNQKSASERIPVADF